MIKSAIVIGVSAIALLTGCKQAAEAPAANATAAAAVTQDEASKAFDATVAAWGSMDAARIKALYGPDIAGFDYTMGPLITDRATWDKNQDAFAGAKLDNVKVVSKKIQLLGPDAFVVTSQSSGTSTAMPKNNSVFRCTDVFQRDAAGSWPIVNEHCSPMPKA